MSRKIAVIGECMIELSQKGAEVSRGFGGDTLNTSVYIARQVAPDALSVSYVTALGTDSFSQQMLEAWQGENVETSLIQRMENRLPGLYYIETDSTGERTFYYWRNEAAAKFWLESDAAAAICEELATFDYLYLSGISLAILSQQSREKLLSLLRECRANGGKVIFDNNYRPRLWASREETQQVYQQMLECTDIAFLTLDDEDALWGEKPVAEVIARTHAAGVDQCLPHVVQQIPQLLIEACDRMAVFLEDRVPLFDDLSKRHETFLLCIINPWDSGRQIQKSPGSPGPAAPPGGGRRSGNGEGGCPVRPV